MSFYVEIVRRGLSGRVKALVPSMPRESDKLVIEDLRYEVIGPPEFQFETNAEGYIHYKKIAAIIYVALESEIKELLAQRLAKIL